MTAHNSTVVGVFSERTQAQQALHELRQADFREDQLGLLSRDESKDVTPVEVGAVSGALAGAGLGGLWAIGIAAGALPAIGPIIVGGLLASLLASAGSGVAIGGIVGALIGLGVSEEEAKRYEEEVKAGRTLVTVKTVGRIREATDIVGRNGGTFVYQGEGLAVHV